MCNTIIKRPSHKDTVALISKVATHHTCAAKVNRIATAQREHFAILHEYGYAFGRKLNSKGNGRM